MMANETGGENPTRATPPGRQGPMASSNTEVKPRDHKPVVGIVGGIASGKSAVAAEFGRLGSAVVDADALAREALGVPSIRRAILARFGSEILDEAGRIDRRALARIVFADGEIVARVSESEGVAVLREEVAIRCRSL